MAPPKNDHRENDMGNIEFRVLKKARCVHFVGTGDISFDYLISRIMDVQKHPDFDFNFNTFIDFENAEVSFREGGIDAYTSFFEGLQKANIHRRWAIYSKSEMTIKSANMSHLLLSRQIEVDVFSVRDQALAFLGITESDLADS
jgi:hypothetical protein